MSETRYGVELRVVRMKDGKETELNNCSFQRFSTLKNAMAVFDIIHDLADRNRSGVLEHHLVWPEQDGIQ